MEVLSGGKDASHVRPLRRLLIGCDLLPVDGLAAWERAAAIWRVAALHADRDFSAISRATGLKLA